MSSRHAPITPSPRAIGKKGLASFQTDKGKKKAKSISKTKETCEVSPEMHSGFGKHGDYQKEGHFGMGNGPYPGFHGNRPNRDGVFAPVKDFTFTDRAGLGVAGMTFEQAAKNVDDAATRQYHHQLIGLLSAPAAKPPEDWFVRAYCLYLGYVQINPLRRSGPII